MEIYAEIKEKAKARLRLIELMEMAEHVPDRTWFTWHDDGISVSFETDNVGEGSKILHECRSWARKFIAEPMGLSTWNDGIVSIHGWGDMGTIWYVNPDIPEVHLSWKIRFDSIPKSFFPSDGCTIQEQKPSVPMKRLVCSVG
jgi:hypothetical protein